MSCMERKVVLRVEIPELKGKNDKDAYEYFKARIGEADEVEFDEDGDGFFSYEGEIRGVGDIDEYRWGVEYVFEHSSNYKNYVYNDKLKNGLTIDDIEDAIDEIRLKFDINRNKVRLLSYDWYNGGDEPVNFK